MVLDFSLCEAQCLPTVQTLDFLHENHEPAVESNFHDDRISILVEDLSHPTNSMPPWFDNQS